MRIFVKIVAVLAALVALLAGGAIAGNKVPLTEPPGLVKRLLIYLTRNSAATRPDHQLAELRSRSYELPADRLFERAGQAIHRAGWQVVEEHADRHELHAVVTTALLGFKDDVRVTLTTSGENRTQVDVASRSRVGRADFGANISHIVEFHRILDSLVN